MNPCHISTLCVQARPHRIGDAILASDEDHASLLTWRAVGKISSGAYVSRNIERRKRFTIPRIADQKIEFAESDAISPQPLDLLRLDITHLDRYCLFIVRCSCHGRGRLRALVA